MGLEPKQRVLKRRKKCSLFLAIREMKIKATLWFYLIPIRMAKINQTANNQRWYGCGDRGTSPQSHIWGLQTGITTMKISMEYAQKPRCKSTIWPGSTTPRHMPKGINSLLYRYLLGHAHCCSHQRNGNHLNVLSHQTDDENVVHILVNTLQR